MFAYTDEYRVARDAWCGIQEGPDRSNRSKKLGIRIYENPVLEYFLSRSHWVLPGVWFAPVIAWGLWRGIHDLGWWTLPALLFGWVFWSGFEYTVHRFIMHISPEGKGPFMRNFLFMAHGYHHEFPNDPWRLVAPPLMSWPLGAIVTAMLWLVSGPAFPAAVAGTFAGYVAYDWVHYYTHHAKPTTALGKYLRKYHIQHHFRDHDAKFGISSPLFDVLLATYGRPVYRQERQAPAAK